MSTTHDPTRYPHNGGNADTDLLCRACELGIPVTPRTATEGDDA